jgi:hypothetical protein
MSEQPQDEQNPLPSHADLLLEALSRPLEPQEQQQVQAELATDPEAAADARVLEILNAHRTLSHWERRQSDAFAQFARALPSQQRHAWLVRLQTHMTRHALAYLSVLLLQTTSIAWLMSRDEQGLAAYRGVALNSCPALKVRFASGVSEEQIRRVLLQVDGHIVDGPDGQGAYAISLPAEKTAAAQAALSPIAEHIDDAKTECRAQ